jgi:putative inorganic carbon (HCO3(-)) transporter
MEEVVKRAIRVGFYLIFLLTPLIVYPKTSEIFEFNKIVFVYSMTVILTALWSIRMVSQKKIIFKRTLLDIPLLVFIASQILSTLFSVDPRTSFFGYYSRFNGGLLSIFSYTTLYWIFVSNMEKEAVQKSIKFLFISTLISSVWAIFEHFGHSFSCLIFPDFGTFDVSCWVQDVQNRVYSTFGQPNWLAAWLVAIIPLTWSAGINSAIANKNSQLKKRISSMFVWLCLFTIFFVTLVFTKSRSGILAFAIVAILFWLLVIISSLKVKKIFKVGIKEQGFTMILTLSSIIVLSTVVLSGTPWTPSISEILHKQPAPATTQVKATGPALETGGTESGKIREIVWKGAIDIWKHFPIFGSGVETFTYSYYQFRPQAHNLVSEWDYLYNKAHNEYLNYLATTGTVGFLSYLSLITIALFLIYKQSLPTLKAVVLSDKKKLTKSTKADLVLLEVNYTALALLSGYVSILVTNFFGFSVVPVAILFYLFPALTIGMGQSKSEIKEPKKLDPTQKSVVGILALIAIWGIFLVFNYWNADRDYTQGKLLFDSGNYPESIKILSELVKKSPKEPSYWEKLGEASAALARSYSSDESNKNIVAQLAQLAISESTQAVTLSPANVNLKRSLASNLVALSIVNPNYLQVGKITLEDAIKQAPTDPKLYYNLSYIYLTMGDYDSAISTMEKAVDLKPDYEKGRFALAMMYEDRKQTEKAKENLKYILEHINPQNTEAKRELDEIDN